MNVLKIRIVIVIQFIWSVVHINRIVLIIIVIIKNFIVKIVIR